MLIGQNLIRFSLRLICFFVVLSLLSRPILSAYARGILPLVQYFTDQLYASDIRIEFSSFYPDVKWQAVFKSQLVLEEGLAFSLISYNLILFLSLLCSLPEVELKHRLIFLVTGSPLIALFHIFDVLLAVESKILTHIQPESYEFWSNFSLWFILVKFFHSLSVMAIKQLVPAFIIALQWLWFKKREIRI